MNDSWLQQFCTRHHKIIMLTYTLTYLLLVGVMWANFDYKQKLKKANEDADARIMETVIANKERTCWHHQYMLYKDVCVDWKTGLLYNVEVLASHDQNEPPSNSR